MVTTEASLVSFTSISERLKEARANEPHPLHPRAGEVEQYIAALQGLERDIAALLVRASDSLSTPEVDALRRRQASIGANIVRQVSVAGRRVGTDRQGSIATLNAIFKLGDAPRAPLDGRYMGDLVALTLHPVLDTVGRTLSRVYMPWTGKRFNAATSTGDNVFTPSVRVVGRLFWPTFSDYRPYKPGLYTAFDFRTYDGPGIADPEMTVLKLDYGNSANPSFLVRAVIDELVQLTSDYYLGKAFLCNNPGDYNLAAFFALKERR